MLDRMKADAYAAILKEELLRTILQIMTGK